MMMETLPPGTLLRGRYRIERVLGSGGFGHVYLAIDEQTRRQFAVKEYLVTGSSGKAQLEHEARVISQLHHPSLPAFQDAFDERGRYYIVLGYIEGNDLTDCLRMVRQKNETIPIERILTWLLSICEAVTFLHSQRPPVIHRDIKPDNIRITPGGTAILVDLGNAKAAADGARTLFFIRHQGTPGYAPLEQYPGGPGTDARSDVYALGGTLFFALTGHEPPSVSNRNTSKSQGTPDLPTLQDMLAQNPPETSGDPSGLRQFRLGVTKPGKPAPRHSRHLAQLATLPPEALNRLNSIIHRAMAMHPQERYQTVAEMSSDLRAVLAGLQAQTPPSPAQGRPFDPHSTQPDLPFLYEAWQKSQGNVSQTTQPASQPAPPPSSSPVQPQDSTLRCPNCQTELPKTATFCPRCGTQLNKQIHKNSQGNSSAPPSGGSANPRNTARANDFAPEPALIYNPAQQPTLRRKSTTGTQLNAPKPFMQAVVPSPRPDSQAKAVQPPQAIPAMQAEPSPAASSSQSVSRPPSTGVSGGSPTRKLLLYIIVAVVVVLLILVIVLVSHQAHTSLAPLHAGQNYALHAQGINDERNFTFCAAPPVAIDGVGLRPCSARLPAATSITQRMDGA